MLATVVRRVTIYIYRNKRFWQRVQISRITSYTAGISEPFGRIFFYFFADKLRKCGPKQGLRAIITYALDLCLKNFKSALRISYSPIMIASNAIIYNFLRGSSTRCSCYNASSRYTHNYPFKFSGLMRVIRVTKFLHTIST